MCENESEVAIGQNGCRENAVNCDLNNDSAFSFVSQQNSFDASDEDIFLEQILTQIPIEESYSVDDQSGDSGPHLGF